MSKNSPIFSSRDDTFVTIAAYDEGINRSIRILRIDTEEFELEEGKKIERNSIIE